MHPFVSPIPLKRRPFDMVLLGFFGINLLLVTYVISLEQMSSRRLLPMPPRPGPRSFCCHHPLVGEDVRSLAVGAAAWYRATIWLDVLVFGPYYATALYAFGRGRDWIRIPSVIWASIMYHQCVHHPLR